MLGAVEQLLLYPWFLGENYNLASSWLLTHTMIACSMDDHILQVMVVFCKHAITLDGRVTKEDYKA